MASLQSNGCLPADYLERVYAGVLGKLIGVYLGRPIEQWPHKDIMEKYGHVRYYLNDKASMELVAADDDISGTFAFIRALEEHGTTPKITAQDIGRTWLNHAIENKCPFWWGGRGYSTEHTAFLNLKHGIAAPASGSIEQNGKTVAEQIGGQIFVDGWALVSPGQPSLAARLADAAASVSHDGEARYAARLWAAMEAEAFVSQDVNHLLDTGLQFVPSDSLLAKMVADVRQWSKLEPDWLKTRQKIEDVYGYDKFKGACHVMPNHAVMILSILYGGHSFHEAMHIVNTSGWDTDCNSGNVGCLVAVMHGLEGIDQDGPDWRGPLADRAIVSSADGGYTVNNAARIAYDIVNSGRKLAGLIPLSMPKEAQFHFTLPGSVQGFQASIPPLNPHQVELGQAEDKSHGSGLQVQLKNLFEGADPIQVLTPTFIQPATRLGIQGYPFVGCPLIYPGQQVTAGIWADERNNASVTVSLRLQVYSPNKEPEKKKLYETNPDLDKLATVDGPTATLAPGEYKTLRWTIPDDMDSQPIANIGIAISTRATRLDGSLWLDYLRWTGSPDTTVKKPTQAVVNAAQAWREAWINNADTFNWYMPQAFGISQGKGEGNIIYGSRDWFDYKLVVSRVTVWLASAGGIMVRNQGLNRYYAFMFVDGGKVALIRAEDERRTELVSASFEWSLDKEYEISISVLGSELRCAVDGELVLEGSDDRYACGAIGLVVLDGGISAEEFKITPS